MKLLCTLIALFIIAFNSNAQDFNKKYDLDFQDFNECGWDWLSYQKNCQGFLDDEPNKHSFRSFTMQYDARFGANDMGFILSKSVILPKTVEKQLNIILTSKSSSTQGFVFKVIALDKNEAIQFEKELRVENASSWVESKISVPGNLKVVNLYIRYIGNKDVKQKIWLKNIRFEADGHDIDYSKIDSDSEKSVTAKLEITKIIDLAEDNTNFLNKIKEINSKKIIGLGENTHGSATISKARIQFLKNLIERGHCRLVLLEIPVDFALLIDLYIQGKIADDSDEVLDGYLKLGLNYKIIKDFLEWLKIFNSKTKSKVHLFGIDNYSAGGKLPLMDYHVALLGPKKSEFYLRKIHENKLNDIIGFVEKDGEIRSILGEKGYIYYLEVLSGEFNSSLTERFSNRDSAMLKRVEFLNGIFTAEDEKTVILAHAGHLQKIKGTGHEGQYDVLGSLLTQRYGAKYYALDFTFGGGAFTQDSCFTHKLMTDTLKSLAKNSFEYAASQTGYSFFFYPAKYIGEDINSTAYIVRNGQNKNPFKFASLQKRFDGYVFSKKSEAMIEVEGNPLLYSIKLFDDKRQFFFKILNTNKQ